MMKIHKYRMPNASISCYKNGAQTTDDNSIIDLIKAQYNSFRQWIFLKKMIHGK